MSKRYDRGRSIPRTTNPKLGIPIKRHGPRHWRRFLPRLDVRAFVNGSGWR